MYIARSQCTALTLLHALSQSEKVALFLSTAPLCLALPTKMALWPDLRSPIHLISFIPFYFITQPDRSMSLVDGPRNSNLWSLLHVDVASLLLLCERMPV